MHAAFGTVVLVVCAVAAGIALLILLLGRKTWDDYGKGRLTFESDQAELPEPPPDAAAADDEIRELLEARNARRERRGERPVDVEQEMSKLQSAGTTSSASHAGVDPELRAEIRELVIARSSRLVRSGKPPLDVDSEVEREIARLSARSDPGASGGGGFKVG